MSRDAAAAPGTLSGCSARRKPSTSTSGGFGRGRSPPRVFPATTVRHWRWAWPRLAEPPFRSNCGPSIAVVAVRPPVVEEPAMGHAL
jgi:hypothetical protein